MKSITRVSRVFSLASALLLFAGIANAHEGKYTETVSVFRNAGESASFFHRSYAYAVFPTVGEAGFIVGGALGKGHVYVHGRLVGDTTMGQASVGFQAGGKAYSQIIFFEDREALEKFESGTFQFEAGASAVAITAGASASVGTSGTSAEASATEHNARATGAYQHGMAVFTIAKGGLMYAATIAGQKFSYTPRGA
jgi:lipid-binding SYLF domain-containing protein